MSDITQVLPGLWSGTVTHDGQVDKYTVTFAQDGTLSMVTPVSKGGGDWAQTGPDRFHFKAKEIFHKEAGMPASYVEITIDATLTGTTYEGTGTATIHAEDGSLIYATTAETSARQPAPNTEKSTAELHYEIVSRLFQEGLNGGDLSVADELMTLDFRNHGSHDDSMTGPESFKFTIKKQRSAFTDVHYEIQDFVSQGDRAAIRWVMRGKHTGEFIGVPATGLEVEHNAMIFFRFEGDKLAERWGVIDNFTLLKTLQAAHKRAAVTP